jgi:phage-related minor tail protein
MEHDLIGASGAQADAIRAIYAEQIKVNAETAKYKVALAQADELRQAGQQMGSAFTSAFGAAIQGGQKLGDVLKSLLTSIENIILKLTVEKWLTDAISGATSGGGFLGGLFGGAAKVAPVATPLSLVGSGLSTVAGIPNARGGAYANSTLGGMDSTILRAPTTFSAFAKGGAFDGIASLGDLTDSIVRAPTYFRPFATGGLAGEAGPEAIMPLSRGSDGTLGVHVTSGGGGGSTPITVNAPITIQGGVNGQTGQMDPKVMAQMQNDLMRALDNAISQKIDQEKRPGGKLY